MATKYRAVKTNGYASKKEAKRAQELRLLERAGKISQLKEQVIFVLLPTQRDPKTGKVLEREVTWKADFTYFEEGNPNMVAEDSKGYKTQQYILRRKMVLYFHNVRVRET